MHAPRKPTLKERFDRSPYFIGAILFHVLIALLIGGLVVFEAVFPPKEFESSSYIMGGGDPGPAPPPASAEATPEVTPQEVSVQSNQPQSTVSDLITVDSASADSFSIPVPTLSTPDPSAITKMTENASANVAKASANAFGARSSNIKGTVSKWGTGGGGSGSPGPQSSGRNTQAEFVCYVAKASGIEVKRLMEDQEGNFRGPIKNLMRMINEWSHGRIKAKVEAKALDVASQVIHEKSPPFIYLSGSKDFKFSESEVGNLRKYLVNGGAVWGDSGLAGVGSRFDVAFRREMKRVIPDADKQFEILPNDHPIFQGDKAFFQLNRGAPPGMNYRQDPIEVIKMDGEIAVIYTPNNYTDMMRVAYKHPLKPNKNDPELAAGFINGKEIEYITPGNMWGAQDTYFRNFTVEGSELSFQLSINIIIHLLTRFQERLMFTN